MNVPTPVIAPRPSGLPRPVNSPVSESPSEHPIEGEMRTALGSVFGNYDSLAVAGRTDTGVHALGNVVSVDVEGGPPAERVAEALNTALPDDVAVVAAEAVAAHFHARHSARSR